MAVSKIKISENGPAFSRFVQGFWRLADWNHQISDTTELIEACIQEGITTFDHADIYGDYTCEDLFGRALSEMNIDRSDVQLVTKCGIRLVSPNRPENKVKSYDTSKQHIIRSVETSLKNLRTDYIDLLLIHRPDPLMNASEISDAFSELRNDGKVLHFGVSNFLPSQFELLADKIDLATNQVEYSVLNMDAQDQGVLDLCQKRGICPMAWSPLGGGRIFTGQTEQVKRVTKTLGIVCEQIGADSIDQTAFAWILRHPVKFLPVLGTGKIERIRSAVKSADLQMTRQQWFEIWQASKGKSIA